MKTSKRSENVAVRLNVGFCVGGALCLATLLMAFRTQARQADATPQAAVISNGAAATPSMTATKPAQATAQGQQAVFPNYTGVPDILKMVDAGVSPEVIKAYINSSPKIYNLGAADIVALKQRGVPEDILAAMMQRSAALQAQAAQSQWAGVSSPAPSTAPAAENLYAPAPVAQAAPQVVYPSDSYAYSYPDYSYPAYGYGYGGYGYAYPWPYYYGPIISIGVGRPFTYGHFQRGGLGFRPGGGFPGHVGGSRPPGIGGHGPPASNHGGGRPPAGSGGRSPGRSR